MEKIYNNFSEFSADYKYDEETDKLGEGGFASVYRADDMIRHREVAVKVSKVPKDERYSLKHEFEVVKSFPEQANIAYYEACYRFKIPGVGLYDLAIMDYYPLGNLELCLANEKFNADQLFYLVNCILEGLSFLHENGAIHRDIKPSNILVTKFSNKFIPKIADFGLGKIMGSDGQSSIENSFIGGSVNYAAPEQILGTKIRSNVDLWAFGVLLFKTCTGELPFIVDESNTSTSIRRERLIKKIVNAEIPQKTNEIAEPFQTIIRKCLVVDPELRVKSAKDLIKILNFDIELDKANRLFESGEKDTALKVYQDLLPIKTHNPFVEDRIKAIENSQKNDSILEEANKLFADKNYVAALEIYKKLSNDEAQINAQKINEANQWIMLDEKAKLAFSNEQYDVAKQSLEKLAQDNPNKYHKDLEKANNYCLGQETFNKAEELFRNKKFDEAYSLYTKIEVIGVSNQKILKEHKEFSKKFIDLFADAEKNLKEKKWKIALKNYQELLKIDNNSIIQQKIYLCEDELNKTVIIKNPPKNVANNDDHTVLITKKEEPKSNKTNDEHTVLISKKDESKPNTFNKDSKNEVKKTVVADTSVKKRNLMPIYLGAAAVITVIFYFILKPKEVIPVVQPTISVKYIESLDKEAESFFKNGEYDKFANLILLMREKYNVDSTVTKSEQLARKLKDFEDFLKTNDPQGLEIVKKISKQSLKLNPKNQTVLDFKEKYKF